MADVTVLGLGTMGSALARALVAARHQTTVWNRNPAKATPLVHQSFLLKLFVKPSVAARLSSSASTVMRPRVHYSLRTMSALASAGVQLFS